MTRAAAVAVGVFAVVGSAAAVDPAQKLGRYRPDDDKKVAAPAPSPLADDTEQVRHRYGWGGYRPYYGGGYRSYYGGGFYGRPSYYGGYYGYRPSFYGSYYGYRPSFYGGGFSYGYSSFYTPRYYYSPSYYYGGFCGIGGDLGSLVTLGLSLRPTVEREFDAAPRALPSPLAPGTFRYDGGPNTVVPQPTPDGRPMPKAEPAPAVPDAVEALKISVKKPAAVKPTPRYKAYGEK
jgi:hypothetical protein